tara:strand:- start:6939 stop:7196 length:258 start_codon:yes stop_codon:yes gene_type:complete
MLEMLSTQRYDQCSILPKSYLRRIADLQFIWEKTLICVVEAHNYSVFKTGAFNHSATPPKFSKPLSDNDYRRNINYAITIDLPKK